MLNTKLPQGTTTLLASASLALGAVLGLLEAYSLDLESSLASSQPLGYSPLSLALGYASLAVTYPVTVGVFYAIGSRYRSGFVTGGNLIAIYGGALVGEILGMTLSYLLPTSSVSFGIPYSFVIAPGNSLSFLFIAFCGFALSNLSRADMPLASLGRGPLVASLVALPFGVEGSFYVGAFYLDASLRSDFQLMGELSLLSVSLLPVELVVFYYLGRRYPITGRTFRYFGQLFLGLYVGSIIGALASVALFGQSSWSLAPGTGSLGFSNGVIYQNVAPSLQVLLESLNPIASLPFMSFFAMALSRTASRAGTPADVRAELPTQQPG